jgi:hypothetical protein
MAASLANEPLAKLMAVLLTKTAIMNLLGVEAATGGRAFFSGKPEDSPAVFPSFVILGEDRAGMPTDTEGWMALKLRLNFNLFGVNDQAMNDLEYAVDSVVHQLHHGGTLDTTNFKTRIIRRLDDRWTRLTWRHPSQTSGNPVLHRTADWLLDAVPK